MISLKVLFSFITKEFRQIFRTREMLILMFGVPIIQLLVLGFAVTGEVKQVKLHIDDRDNTKQSRSMYEGFEHTDRFKLVPPQAGKSSESLIENWQAQMVIIIPSGFGKELDLGRKPELVFVADGIDGNTAAVAMGYASGIIGRAAEQYYANMLSKKGGSISLKKAPGILVVDRMWYNEDLDPAQYMIPGIVVILITIISMMMSAMSLVKEKEIGTMEQLMVSPARKSEMLLGKLLPYWLISLFEICAVTIIAHFIFGIRFQGNPLNLGLMAGVYLITTLGIGIFISTLTETQQQAMFFSWFMMIFMILLSGLFVPIQNMPASIRTLTLLNPMSYFLALTRDIMIKGTELKYLLKGAFALLVYGISVLSLSLLMFRKTVK